MAHHSVAIVTGSGRGIGAAIAKGLALDGFAVAVNFATDEAAAARTAAEIRAAGGVAAAIQADVAQESDVVRLFATVDRDLGAVTALVNNGGVTGGFSRVDALSAAALERVFAVNVIGAFLCCREAVRRMSTRRGGEGGSGADQPDQCISILPPRSDLRRTRWAPDARKKVGAANAAVAAKTTAAPAAVARSATSVSSSKKPGK